MIILRSSVFWSRSIGAGCFATGIVIFLHFLRSGPHLAAVLLSTVRAWPFLGGGVAVLLLPQKKTEFDLRRRYVALWRRSAVGLVKYRKIRSDEIASVGFVRYLSGGPIYIEVTLKDGVRYKVSSWIVGRTEAYKAALDRIRDAMELVRSDRRGRLVEFIERPTTAGWRQV